MQEIQFIAPAALHDEMLRLRNEKQMDFLESLTGMDWGVADEKDAPEKTPRLRRSLPSGIYHYRRTDSTKNSDNQPRATGNTVCQRHLEDSRLLRT